MTFGASVSLNKSRTVPRCLHDLGTAWAKRSRKVLDGPPDAKRRPASAATERGAYEKSKSKSHAADSKRIQRKQQSAIPPPTDVGLLDISSKQLAGSSW